MTTFPLQQAVYDALNTDSALATLMGLSESPTDVPVFDGQAPDDQAMPYLVIGGGGLTTDDTKDADWSNQRVMVHTFSDYRGHKEVRQIMAGVKAALHDQALTVAGNTLVELYLGTQEDFPEGDLDSLVRHGVQIFRARTVET
jgi:hypothetical protein